jgi:hypothetical protein
MMKWIKQLLCLHTKWKELYYDIVGMAELHYCYICKNCGKERSR